MSLVEVVLAVHDALDAAVLPHSIGGALALAYATDEPRGTADLDVNVFVPVDQARRVLESMPEATVWDQDKLARLERDGQVRVFLHGYPVDVFLSTDAFHDEAQRRVRVVPFGGREIPILDGADLAVFKAFFNRRKDWADLEAMARSEKTDMASVLERVTALLGADDPRVEALAALLREVQS
jgi:pimeloyl-ACP methyl ester carboxylesterase